MRNVYVVCYDISDDRRLRRVYKTMRGFGDHLQLSVFRCELSARERASMISALVAIIAPERDQVLIVDIGPADGRADSAFETVGRAYRPRMRHAIII
jgi:CRISPR-associated protein Cas2